MKPGDICRLRHNDLFAKDSIVRVHSPVTFNMVRCILVFGDFVNSDGFITKYYCTHGTLPVAIASLDLLSEEQP